MIFAFGLLRWRAFGIALLLAAAVAAPLCGSARGGEIPSEFPGSAASKHAVGPHADPNSPNACRPQDEIWVVSTRDIDCVASGEAPALSFAVRGKDGKLLDANLQTFVAATKHGQSRFWFHGYGVTADEAIEVGQVAYERFVSPDEPPVRFVVWSWPSEREGRRLKDIREKGCRTFVESYCFGWLLAQMSSDAETSAVGYSYGTRIISGGLHLVGGGELTGLRLATPMVNVSAPVSAQNDEQPATSRSCRAVLLAAAMGNDWLVEGGCTDRALGQTSQMLSIYSSCDRVLKWYPAASRGNGEALGYRGLAQLPPREDGNGKYGQLDVAYLIGTYHDLETYLGHLEITAAAREALSPQSAAAK